jgi:zona occludens toxin
MPIFLITGLPGHGKTLYALTWVQKEFKDRTIYHNRIPDLILPWEVLEDPLKWPDMPTGGVAVLDECQKIFPVRGSGARVPDHVSALETHRHHGHDLVLITQHPRLLDKHVLSLVDTHIHVVRPFGMERATVHRFPAICMSPERTRSNSVQEHFTYPKESFTWYKSSEKHTVKRRIPMRIGFLALVPLLLGGVAYYFYDWQSTRNPTAPSVAAKASVAPPLAATIREAASDMIKPDYMESQKPRVPGLAYTAPLYDRLNEPVSAPRPSACVASARKCLCYTDQATALEVPDHLCRDIATNGYYDSTRRSSAAPAPATTLAEPKTPT